jgi:N-acyl-D-aspartate/D-glutamate deacylase
MLDLLIRGGQVVDGTGAPARRADVGVREGRVVAIGAVDEPARRVIDADGLMVAPGFVDLHTHYDAQLFWDPSASPSPLHGVTTVIGGNCGFSLAPAGPDHAAYLTAMLARVEGMPLAALQAGLDWDWVTFGDWLDRLEGRVGVNAGFLVGHSTLRRVAMGDDAVGKPASPAQVAAMVEGLERALSDGALGFSTSQAHTHHDGDGLPVPSRAADRPELEALAAAVRRHPGTTLELIVSGALNGFSEEEVDLMASLSLLADRPVNWNVLGVSAADPARTAHQLAASDAAAARGATVVALTLPHTMRIRLSFETGTILDGLPGWREVLALPTGERLAALADPEVRARMEAGASSDEAGTLRLLAQWKRLVIEETFAPQNAPYEGRTVGEVAAQRGQSPFDAMLDVVVADELHTGLRPPIPEMEGDWAARAGAWLDPRTIVGGSDAGAHLDTMCGAVYTTSLLADGVRRRSLLSWEEAVHQLSDVPARLYGLRHRGRLDEGWWADVVVFDPAEVGYGPERTRNDLPGGAPRLYAEATGVEHVLVNGTEVVRHGALTGERPGQVLRSGRDTDTVGAAGPAQAPASTANGWAGSRDPRNSPASQRL